VQWFLSAGDKIFNKSIHTSGNNIDNPSDSGEKSLPSGSRDNSSKESLHLEGATDKKSSKSDPKYSKAYKLAMTVSSFLDQALSRLLLGDAHLGRGKRQVNARLVFDQSKNEHSEYIYYLYELFKAFVATEPKSTNRKPDKRTGKVYDSLIFRTLAFPCFNKYYDLFYPNGKKIIEYLRIT
jgi:hypothetical protein